MYEKSVTNFLYILTFSAPQGNLLGKSSPIWVMYSKAPLPICQISSHSDEIRAAKVRSFAGLKRFCWTFVHFILEHKFSTADISHTVCQSVTKIGRFTGLANRDLFSEFCEPRSGASRDTMRRHISVLHWCACFFYVFKGHVVNKIDELWQQVSGRGLSNGTKFGRLIVTSPPTLVNFGPGGLLGAPK